MKGDAEMWKRGDAVHWFIGSLAVGRLAGWVGAKVDECNTPLCLAFAGLPFWPMTVLFYSIINNDYL
jgi:hypothetical protein